MNASTLDRQPLNFPAATAADWTAARRSLERFARAHDLDHHQAEELAQAALTDMLTRTYSERCPATLAVAVGWRLHTARKHGVWTLAPGNTSRRRRAGMEPAPVRDVAPSWTDPARMAEAGESLAERMPRLAMHARRIGTTPAGLALRATGWGEEQEPGTVPSVTDVGPGFTPPPRGCPGLHTDTDPRPTWHRYQPQPLTGDALDRYREALADHYANR